MRTSLPLFCLATGLFTLTLLTGCSDDGNDDAANETETGDPSGDGDGDATGDGDGEPATGDGDGEPATGDGDGDTEPVLSDLTVNVTYEGDQTGTLYIAALTSYPPVGPPLAFVAEPEPSFPYSGMLMALEPGDYFVTAILDIGSDNPMSPGDEDLVAVTDMAITVSGEGEPAPVELVLMDL